VVRVDNNNTKKKIIIIIIDDYKLIYKPFEKIFILFLYANYLYFFNVTVLLFNLVLIYSINTSVIDFINYYLFF